jgi:hypothetical protein
VAKENEYQARAREQLEALAKVEGALVIITAEKARNGHADPRHPRHWVLHDVVEVQDHPSKPGVVVAVSAEGDATWGYPAQVLARLTEAGRAEP